ncbi:Ig-like domain-containing protein [Paucibacter sp. PLA-PC-4]|uniref:Ig-like domain-containing protein n=1 Tax=Paucibacter sp. PLA-PC-4 TaxID=2993655 RepID=UPI002249751D|nr:Ig-like domain-containing protein [Paucibacter sp. PLA-PC-4]MCX2861382.1 Ig-like domain-containing protein [Paucibacter sp. PLA-PC-4]
MTSFKVLKSSVWRYAMALGLTALLGACGGGGGASGDPVVGGGDGTTPPVSRVADLALQLSPETVANDGSQQATLTVTSLDAARNATGGVPVSLQVVDPLNTAFLTGAPAVTDATTGQLTAQVSLGSGKGNRSISLKAVSGTIEKSVTLNVVDAVVVVPVANDMSIELSRTNVTNTGTDPVEVTVTAVDSARNAVPGLPVRFVADDIGAVIVVGNGTTDVNGQAKASVRIGANRTNRTIKITANIGALSREASFIVTGSRLTATLLPATLTTGSPGQVEYTLTDSGSNPMANVDITVSGPGTSSGAGKTNAQGKYIYSYVAAGTGPTLIASEAPGGVRLESTVQIDASVSDVPAGTMIASATFTASPVVVSVNQVGSTSNRSELRLLFRSDKNEPVPNVRVRLGFGANVSGTDGDISSGKDKVIVADANGVAVSSFIAGRRSSPTEQLKIYACFGKTDAVEQIAACPAERLRTVSLTVVEEAVSVSIGSNNLVIVNQNTYAHDFTVLVVDAAGNPRPDAQLAAVLDLPTYRKGFWNRVGSTWVKNELAACINEDNAVGVGYRNGTIETGEDVNGSGQLDPRKSDVSISFVGSTRTNAAGMATLRIEYAQSFGSWVEFSIRVSASGVVSPPAWTGRLAAEGDTVGTLKGTARLLIVPADILTQEGAPPFVLSPYGTTGNCASPN